ncbi:phosphopantetheine-binding protein, partial [Streptomyces sp. NPDC054838]
GMAGALGDADAARLRRSGIVALPRAEALDLFDAACARADAVLLPLRIDPAAAREALPPVLRPLADRPETRRAAGAARAGSPGGDGGAGEPRPTLADRVAGLPRAERSALVLDLVRTEVAAVLGYAGPAEVGVNRSFREAGFDSLTAVELRNRLSAGTGLRLTATLVFDHPTPLALAEHIDGELPGAEAAVLDLIGRLGEATALADLDEGARRKVADRLSALLAGLGTAPAPAEAVPSGASDDNDNGTGTGTGTVTELLHSASDDELFQLLDSGFRAI